MFVDSRKVDGGGTGFVRMLIVFSLLLLMRSEV